MHDVKMLRNIALEPARKQLDAWLWREWKHGFMAGAMITLAVALGAIAFIILAVSRS